MTGQSDETRSLSEEIAPFVGRAGGLIAALRAVQAARGFLPPETEAAAAEKFNLSRAEVKGVISFYADFRRAAPGRTVVRVCAAEACQAQGGRMLKAEVERRLALKTGSTSPGGDVTLNQVYCLGLCSVGPSAMIDGRLMAKATADKILAVVDARRTSGA